MPAVDRPFAIVTIAVASVVVVATIGLRFCGTLAIPAKPPAPTETKTAGELLSASVATNDGWRAYLTQDAVSAGVATPTLQSMTAKFPYRSDDTHRSLAPDDPPVEAAGLGLVVTKEPGEHGRPQLVLAITNTTTHELAYRVATRPSMGTQVCFDKEILTYNAMVIAPGATERRDECGFRVGMQLTIDKVETMEVGALSAWYLERLPPAAVGIEPRLAKGHRANGVSTASCNVSMSQALRAELEQGTTGWRDLVDFYARHRCETYQFREGYKYFTTDNERPLPDVH